MTAAPAPAGHPAAPLPGLFGRATAMSMAVVVLGFVLLASVALVTLALPVRQVSVQSAAGRGEVVVVPELSAKPRRDTGPPKTGPGELDVLLGFLDYLRASVIAKAQGVPEPQVRAPGVPSGTNLLGLVKHLTNVERHWLLGQRVTDWAATFHAEPAESVDDILRAYRETIARVNEVLAACPDLAAAGPRPGGRPGPAPSLRWTLTHLIEETGRHAGHADILRELIDGATGR